LALIGKKILGDPKSFSETSKTFRTPFADQVRLAQSEMMTVKQKPNAISRSSGLRT
jgi:hypothetical protein